MKSILAWTSLAFVALLVSGCVDQKGTDTKFQTVSSSAWNADLPREFTLDSITALRYHRVPVDLDIIVRYSARNAPDTIPLVVLQESYLQPPCSDTLLIPLRNPKGEPTGHGRYGVYTTSHTLHTDSLPDGWRLTLSPPQGVIVNGIQAVGYSLGIKND